MEVNGGAEIKIEPKIEIKGEKEIKTDEGSMVFIGQSSHKDLHYYLKNNGEYYPVDAKYTNEESGEFVINLDKLTKGNNFIQFYYSEEKDGPPQLFAEKKVVYTPKILSDRQTKYSVAALVLFITLTLIVFLRKKYPLLIRVVSNRIKSVSKAKRENSK